jgi:hypothetical protein
VADIERFARRHVGIHVNQSNFFNDSAQLKGECGVGSNTATATNNANFHPPSLWQVS